MLAPLGLRRDDTGSDGKKRSVSMSACVMSDAGKGWFY